VLAFSNHKFILFCCFGCYQNPISTEPLPIPTEKLVPLLVDVHLAEAVLIDFPIGSARDSAAAEVYTKVLALHKIDSSDYENTQRILSKNPQLMATIHEQVLLNLQNKSASLPPH
jgi:Domain of unknown function (DUF4296)